MDLLSACFATLRRLAAFAPVAGLAVALAPVATFAQATPLSELRFEDPAFRECLMAEARKQSWTTTADVTTIQCHGGKIERVDELAAFENLRRASFFRNRISRVTLGDMPALERLNLAQNGLTHFEIGAVPALRELYLFRNRLDRFIAVGWPALAKLRISENRLTSIRLENLPALAKAHIHDNKLETIDLSIDLPALSFVDLRLNPLPDPVYDVLDAMEGVTIPHDGNAEDWE